MSPYLYPGPSI